MTLYTVRAWTPGYLPESDDEWTTDDLTTARSVLASEIERDWDDAQLWIESGESLVDIDSRYLPAHTSANTCAPDESLYVPAPAWQTRGLGRCYAIVTVEIPTVDAPDGRMRWSGSLYVCDRCDFRSALTECECDTHHVCADDNYAPDCTSQED